MNASAIPQGAKKQSLLIAVFGICLFSIFFAGLFQRVEEVQAVAPPSIITYQGKLLSSGDSVTTSQSMQFPLIRRRPCPTLSPKCAKTMEM